MRAYISDCLEKMTGQKPVFTNARMSISSFKVREGMVVGAKVTLRGNQMEQFLDRLISYTLPRIRDFRGLPTKLDGHGNYAIGLRDHSVFPEVPPPDAKQIFGLQIQITTTAKTDEAGKLLLKEMGMPFTPPAEPTKSIKEPKPEPAPKKEEVKPEQKDDKPVAEEATIEDTDATETADEAKQAPETAEVTDESPAEPVEEAKSEPKSES